MCRTSLEEYKNYYKGLKKVLESKKDSFVGNSGHGHNAVVMRLMLENSRVINMYCGSLSVFSDSFFSEIEKRDSAEVANQLKDDLKSALSGFLDNGGRLNIILENYTKDWQSHIIIGATEWTEYVMNGQISVRYIPDILTVKKNINHVAFNDTNTIERLEIDKDRHAAICRLNSSDCIKNQNQMFQTLTNCSEPISA